jgi:poly(A) polymerase
MLKRIREFLTGRGATDPAPPPPQRDHDRNPVEVPAVHYGPKVVHQPIPLSDIDPDAVKILRRLSRFDHTAYLVGGCVRDLLLDRHPKDFDIGTTATPRQVKRLFSNCRIIGRRFRLAHVYFQNGKIVEVATFRARDVDDDPPAPDNGDEDLLIRDDNIFGTPEEDALRRDFTINALFYDVNDENVLDHTDGLGDLRRRLVRTIGDPEIRFREDPIRILRAIKFAARLDFEIEAGTLDALKRTRSLIPRAASARILEEVNRFCRGGAARKSIELLRETGVLEVVLPDFAERYLEDADAWRYLLHLLDALDRRRKAGHEISTGEILVVLMLPLLSPRMGWHRDGGSAPPRGHGVNVRDLADEMLRPMALRLRVARKDQEHCRQCLMTLHRMVPMRNLRPGAQNALAQRPCTPDCLWILEAASQYFVERGEFDEAFRFWSAKVGTAAPSAPTHGPRPQRHAGRSGSPDQQQGAPAPGEPRRRRRRSRRGRRRGVGAGVGAEGHVAVAAGGGDDGGKAVAAAGGGVSVTPDGEPIPQRQRQQPPQPRPKSKPMTKPAAGKREDNMPPPWDDGYFFAALPTVPQTLVEEGGNEGGGGDDDRYGAASLIEPPAVGGDGDGGPIAGDSTAIAGDGGERRPGRRRRRRRRRGGGGGDRPSGAADPVP